MNVRLLILSIVFLRSVSILASDEINFEHKAIQKEIVKQLEINDFRLLPFFSEDSSSNAGQYFTISSKSLPQAYAYIGRIYSCRSGGCSVSTEENSNSAFEYFDYLIIYSNAVEILSVKVFNYQATHGHEVCSRSWLKQFAGYSGKEKLEVGKDIDGISGATVSVYSLTFDIEKVSSQLRENLVSQNLNAVKTVQTEGMY